MKVNNDFGNSTQIEFPHGSVYVRDDSISFGSRELIRNSLSHREHLA